MADYIYLLENRLSLPQRNALKIVREAARQKLMTLFLVGGAVRDLTSGSPVRDLDVVVQGNASKLRKELEKAGAVVTGENDAMQAFHLRMPGNVRMEVGSTVSVAHPKPGKAVVKPATLLDDLRRRDFTANAMALSLNEGSYGLLMDPLNGVADIENRELRLVSNYGFIEEPVRMIRAARLMARLGWMMDEKTEQRYRTGVEEGFISALSEAHRGYELEEVFHEEDPLRVLRRLEAEGWMKQLAPYLTSAKVNTAELDRLREVQTTLQMQNLHPDTGAANFPLLTAKLTPKEIAQTKESFARPGFVTEIESLETQAKDFVATLSGKQGALPSQAWRIITEAAPEAVLWAAFTSKAASVQGKLKSFSTEWPQARARMPYVLMQEMRITPDLPGYEDLLQTLFFALMDGGLTTSEEMKAFLEPYSPPAPPPPINLRRARTAARKETRPGKKKKAGDEPAAEPVADVPPVIEAPAPPPTEVLTDSHVKSAPKSAARGLAKAPAKSEAKPKATTTPAATPIAKTAPKPSPAAKMSAPKSAPAAQALSEKAKKPAPPAPAKAAKKTSSAPKVAAVVVKKSPPARQPSPAKKAVRPAPGKPIAVKAVAGKASVSSVKGARPRPAKRKAAPARAVPAKTLPAKKTASASPSRTVPAKGAAVAGKPAKKTAVVTRAAAKKTMAGPRDAKKAPVRKPVTKQTRKR